MTCVESQSHTKVVIKSKDLPFQVEVSDSSQVVVAHPFNPGSLEAEEGSGLTWAT